MAKNDYTWPVFKFIWEFSDMSFTKIKQEKREKKKNRCYTADMLLVAGYHGNQSSKATEVAYVINSHKRHASDRI